MARPYERREKESDPAWEAFVLFRDMGIDRSLVSVAAALSKSQPLMWRWSATHEWKKRAHAWDMEVDRRDRIGALKGVEDMRRRQTKLALQGQDIVTQELAKLLNASTKYDGAAQLEPAMLIKFMEVCTKLERVVRGEPGEIIQTTGNDAVDLTDVSLEDLKALRRVKNQVRARAEADGENDTVH